MPEEIPSYPKILTNTDWQANKGKLAKLAKGTGIGELMKKCEAEHGKIEWYNKYQASRRIDWRTVDPAKDKFEVVTEVEKDLIKEYMADAAPIRKLLAEIRDAAKKTAADWKKNKLIPSSSVKHAEEVSKMADFWCLLMKETSDGVKKLFGADELRKSLEKKKQETLKVVNIQIGACEKGLAAVLKKPTKQCWEDDGAHQGCRSVSNGIAAIPEFKKLYFAKWQEFGDFYCKDIPDNDPQEAAKVINKVKVVAGELAKYKQAVAKMLGH